MTKLEQLIKERCPKGVDFYELQQILEFKNGKGHEKNITSYGKYIVVNSKFISTDGNVKKYSNEQICPLYKNDILMVMSDLPNGKALAKCFIVDEDNKYTLNQRICSLSVKNPNLTNYKFLYYYLNRNRQLLKYDNGVDQTNLKKDNILKIRIPIPPLEIQNTIVRILDNFTKLIAELIAELDARQKQYAYYRDYLLTFDDNNSLIDDIASIDTKNVTYMKLGDISTIVRGASPRPIRNYVTNDIDGVNWIKIGDVKSDSKYIFSTKEKITKDGAEKSRYVCKGDFILSNSMSFGRPYILKIDGCIHDGWLSISGFENYVIADYLYYILVSAPVQREMRKKASFGGAVQNLNSDIVKGLIIPIPSIETQNNIVSILNRFDELCNGISEGLPAEIEARKKQYEYYRDALLSFDEKTCSQIVKVERERERELSRSKSLKWVELGDILKIKNGKDYKAYVDGNIPVYGSGGIMTYIDTYAYDKPSVLIPRKGSIDKLYYVDTPFWTVDTIFYTEINTNIVLAKYVYYWLKKEHLGRLNTAGGVPSLTQAVLNRVKIAIPTIEEQERIVSVLDRFDKLCNDISEGLPAEINARQKQYEYYRDKLLTFKEKIS